MVTHATLRWSAVAFTSLLTTGIWTETATGAAIEPVRPEYANLDQVVTTARRCEEDAQTVPGTITEC